MLWNSCHATQPEGKLTPNPQVTGGTESQTLPLMTQSVTLVPTPCVGEPWKVPDAREIAKQTPLPGDTNQAGAFPSYMNPWSDRSAIGRRVHPVDPQHEFSLHTRVSSLIAENNSSSPFFLSPKLRVLPK